MARVGARPAILPSSRPRLMIEERGFIVYRCPILAPSLSMAESTDERSGRGWGHCFRRTDPPSPTNCVGEDGAPGTLSGVSCVSPRTRIIGAESDLEGCT